MEVSKAARILNVALCACKKIAKLLYSMRLQNSLQVRLKSVIQAVNPTKELNR